MAFPFMKDTPWRFHQFVPPSHAPFDDDETWWPTVVGEFFAPIVKDDTIDAFVFLNHRRGAEDIELRFASKDYERIEKAIEGLMANLGISRKEKGYPKDGETVGENAYHGTRWIAAGHDADFASACRRSELIVRFLHSGCALFIDNLVRDGARWKIEKNTDEQNPRHNLFESQLHLISNFSLANFDIWTFPTENGARAATRWMLHPPFPAGLEHAGVCRL